MNLSLVVMTPGKSEGKAIPIALAQFVIGRDPQCHLRPASSLISKRHCALVVREGKVFVRDFESTNGTFVNDQPVKGEVPLRHNDTLKVGPLLFGVRIEAAKNAPASTTATVSTPAASTPTATAPAAPASAAPGTAPAKSPPPKPALAKTAAGSAPKPAATMPRPVTPPAPAEDSPGSIDDDIAAMLLETDGSMPASGTGVEVPEGSTVMDIVVTPEGQEPKAADAAKEKDKDKPKVGTGNTSTAAAAILEQYRRRPRS